MRRWLIIAAGIFALSALSGGAAYQGAAPGEDLTKAAWQEIAWPFPRDGWPAGKTFRCGADDCGPLGLSRGQPPDRRQLAAVLASVKDKPSAALKKRRP